MLIFRKKNPNRPRGNEIVPYDEFTKGKVVWVSDTDDPTARRREYVCTGNGIEVMPMNDFHALVEAERETARRRGGFYSRSGELASGLHETRRTVEEVNPMPTSAMGATA